MVRNKIISITMAVLLSVNSFWDASPVFYESMIADAKTASQTEETKETEVVSDAGQVTSNDYGLPDNSKDGAILHAWCWSFNTIKTNLKDIAEAGFTTVQTCPINECFAGEGGGMQLWGNGKWYYHYQPTDWVIGNYQLGSRDDYKAMCAEADKYGVKIISDVLPNHTTPTLDAVSQNLANAAGGKTAGALYHSCGFNEIQNYSDRYECTLGQMGGLPDVNTENQGFQEYYLKFCNDVISCGGDGFRYDTAKHVGVSSDPKDASNTRGVNDFWDVATGKKSVNGVSLNKPDNFFIYGEVLQDNGIPYSEYASYMNLTASSYGYVLRDSNLKNNSLNAGGLQDWCHSTPDKIVTWVESHDTYCNDHESAWMNDFQIRAGWAVIAARSKGTPLFFSRPDGSNGSSGNYWGNNQIGAKGNDQFKHPEVAACNHFRNAMVGESEYMSNPNGNSSVLVIERGTKGAVIINMGSSVSNISLSKVADGTYTEEVSGQTVQVSGGTLNCTVPGGSIAVVYNVGPVKKTPKVTASKESGSFQDAFTLTLTASNATKATYSVDGGEEVEFTDKATVKIGEDASIGDKITVKVKAEGDGETFTETFTYTMSEAPAYKMMLRVKKSDFSSAPTLYLYSGEGTSAKEYNGAWPGKAMTADGDYYVYNSDSVESATAILVSGTWRSTEDMQPGLTVTGCMEYDKTSNKFTTFTPSSGGSSNSNSNNAGKKTPEVTTTPKVTATPKVTKVPEVTVTPKITETPKVTVTTTPTKENTAISVSKASGSSFNTETMDVKITLDGAESGTYILDGGLEKTFQSGDTVTIGQGKIADSEITLRVSATINKKKVTQTFTYAKVFDPNTAEVKVSAITKLQSLFEIVSDAAQVNGAAETGGMYATNPNGVGKEATITIDGSFSDWSEDMLIAQGGAWDIANNWKGGHENCVLDDYALYAAWDDENLYIGWQMVNTTDTWANSGDGPLSDGGRVLDVPLMLAINVGNRPAMTGKMANGKLIWDALQVEFDTRVDNILLMSGKVGLGTPGYFIAADESGGASYDADYCLSFKTEGISYAMAEDSMPTQIMGLADSSSPEDAYDSSKYVDMMGKGHSRAYDSFYEINIPLKTLGIDKSYIEENGIGVMQLATRGTSAIDCLPHDPSMLDNVTGECAVDPSTSHEKDDTDVITVPLAAVGNAKAGGEGGSSNTTTPTKKTEAPKETEAPEETEAPKETEKLEETKEPEEKATSTPTAEPKETEVPKENVVSDVFTVNFGADRSSPQLNENELLLSAIAYGGEKGTKGYKYTFYVDNKAVMKSVGEASYVWTPEVGNHKIKVVVEDNEGNKISSEKAYVIESVSVSDKEEDKKVDLDKDIATATPIITKRPTATPLITQAPIITKEPETNRQDLKISMSTNKVAPRKAGTTIKLALNATGGKAPYTYIISVKSGKQVSTILSNQTKNSVNWKPTKAGTYIIYGKVMDADGEIVSVAREYSISSPISVKTFKLNKTTIKKGKTLNVSAKATSISKVKYQFKVVNASTKKVMNTKKYSTKSTYSWKAKKKGKYYIYLQLKDTKGNTKTVKKTVRVK